MLVAEIHGKGNRAMEDVEDLLTSAVFGHLRLVQPPVFWPALLSRIRTAERPSRSLAQILVESGTNLRDFTEVKFRFWPNFSGYGEPDIEVMLHGAGSEPITLLIEVKLNSGKSGTGESDQLSRYLNLLHDPRFATEWPSAIDRRFVVYLTKSFSAQELQASCSAARSLHAPARIFGLEWVELAEIAQNEQQHSELLREVAKFLKRRGFERFHGFASVDFVSSTDGRFYSRRYFNTLNVRTIHTSGRFYVG